MQRKEISVKDLKIGDKVVGMHRDRAMFSCNVVAGEITSIEEGDDQCATVYHVRGKTFPRSCGEPIKFSGILEDNEIEVIDPGTYNVIIELYELGIKQQNLGIPCLELAEKISDMRHRSRQELEVKYAVVGGSC